MISFRPEILSFFQRTADRGGWKGPKPISWLDYYAFEGSHSDEIMNSYLDRTTLRALRDNSSISTPDLCAFVFIWGGMDRRRGQRLLKNKDASWLKVSQQLRSGCLDAAEGYQAFHDLWQEGELRDLGPAYYTKLLFFLPPLEKRGVIMDQWTSRSINLLAGDNIVRVDVSHVVSPHNAVDVYRKFCAAVDELAKIAIGDASPTSVESVEMMLFSEGGAKKAAWREFVSKDALARSEAVLEESHPYREVDVPSGTSVLIVGTAPPPRFSLRDARGICTGMRGLDFDFFYGSEDNYMWAFLADVAEDRERKALFTEDMTSDACRTAAQSFLERNSIWMLDILETYRRSPGKEMSASDTDIEPLSFTNLRARLTGQLWPRRIAFTSEQAAEWTLHTLKSQSLLTDSQFEEVGLRFVDWRKLNLKSGDRSERIQQKFLQPMHTVNVSGSPVEFFVLPSPTGRSRIGLKLDEKQGIYARVLFS